MKKVKYLIISLLFFVLGGGPLSVNAAEAYDDDPELAQALQESRFEADLKEALKQSQEDSQRPRPKTRSPSPRSRNAFLIIGISEKELTPHPQDPRGLHPLLKKYREGTLPPDTYFLDQQNSEDGSHPYFIRANFSEPDFSSLAQKFPEKFEGIYFDYSTIKFLHLDKAEMVFTTLFRMLKKGGRLYIPAPSPGMIIQAIPIPEDVKLHRDDAPTRAWKALNRKKVIDDFIQALIEALKKSGYSKIDMIEQVVESPKHQPHDPIAQAIGESLKGGEQLSKGIDTQEFPVLMAQKSF